MAGGAEGAAAADGASPGRGLRTPAEPLHHVFHPRRRASPSCGTELERVTRLE